MKYQDEEQDYLARLEVMLFLEADILCPQEEHTEEEEEVDLTLKDGVMNESF